MHWVYECRTCDARAAIDVQNACFVIVRRLVVPREDRRAMAPRLVDCSVCSRNPNWTFKVKWEIDRLRALQLERMEAAAAVAADAKVCELAYGLSAMTMSEEVSQRNYGSITVTVAEEMSETGAETTV